MPSLPAVTNTSLASSFVPKIGPGVLHDCSVTCTATAGYLLIFDSATVPADGAVTPTYSYEIDKGSAGFNFEPNPWQFKNGLVMVLSSSGPFTKTAIANGHFTARFE